VTFQFFDPEKPVVSSRGHLPHWDQEDATYFITWRTADSIPLSVWNDWRQRREGWLRRHGINPSESDWRSAFEELSEEQRKEFRRFAKDLENEMDSCHGECLLRDPECAGIVENALRHFDGHRYTLGDFVIMPNHVHLLVAGMPRRAMLAQVTSWKKWSAIQVNKRLGRSGRFWQDEHFDHLVRGEMAFERFRRYIAENPGKAKLRPGEFIHWQRPD
jgi:putative transposase